MVIFLKILYGLLIAWNLVRVGIYMIFATFDDDTSPEKLETRVNLLWAILHAICVCWLFICWRVIFG